MVTALPLSKDLMASMLVFLDMNDILEWRGVASSTKAMWASESHVLQVTRRMAIDLYHARDQLKAMAQLAPGPRLDGSEPIANRDLHSSKWKRALNIGHKGAAGHLEGNTMASFVEAVRLGVDMIEFDVLTTVDGVVICFHDPVIEETGEWIENLTLIQIRERLKHSVVTLEEMLQEQTLVMSAVHLYIDLKHTEITRPVLYILCQAVERWGWAAERLLVGAFQQLDLLQVLLKVVGIDMVNAFRQAVPGLAGLRTVCILDGCPISVGRDLEALGVAALSVGKGHVTPDLVADCQRRGVKVWVWTVNSLHIMEHLLKMGVDGICTDYPERVIEANHRFRPGGGEETSQAAATFPFPMAPNPSAGVDLRDLTTKEATSGESGCQASTKKVERSIDSPALGGLFSRSRYARDASAQWRIMSSVYGDFVGVRDTVAGAVREMMILADLCSRAAAVKAFLEEGGDDTEPTVARKLLASTAALCKDVVMEAERVLLPIASSAETTRWLGTVAVTNEGRDFALALERSIEVALQPLLPFEKIFVNKFLSMVREGGR